MAQYLINKNPASKPWALEYAKLYLEEGETEGVRGDGAWIQSCKETGNFKFFGGTAVTFDQNNFCGMGVTQKGMKGNSFSSPRLGIRAQIQHLKGYATSVPLKQACIDPRYKYINPKGKAPRFEDLAGKWAVPGYDTKKASSLEDAMKKGIGYGFEIIAGIEEMKETKSSISSQTEAVKMAGYTNSPLVNYTKISPNRTSPRNHAIDTFSIHCYVGQVTAERGCNGKRFINYDPKNGASCNYVIGCDGSKGLCVEEKDRSWCTSNRANDMRAITIEVASDTQHPYAVTDAALNALIDLMVDICKRNGKKKVLWFADKTKTLAYKPKQDEMVMTVHRWFAAKSCLPSETELLTKDGWKSLNEIQIGDEVASADLENLNLSFEEVYDKVPIKTQDTYTNNELTATKDHRMIYCTQNTKGLYRIEYYKNLLNKKQMIYIPLAGTNNFDGINITDEMIKFLCAVQADGHYMYEKDKNGQKKYYGLEFHFSKERKIDRIKEILEKLNFPYNTTIQANGSTKIRIYNYDKINIVEDICEKYLCEKHFTWDWIKLSKKQASLFLKEILLWDGCISANSYFSKEKIDLDVVNAIAALNSVGSRVIGSQVQFRQEPYITLGENTVRNNHRYNQVSCVSVKTGLLLIRQFGKTFIVGNCPGDYLYSKHAYIAEQVNKRLGSANVMDATANTAKPSASPSVSSQKYAYQGIDYSPVFNPTYYADKYTDLKKAFGTNSTALFNHFCTYGMKEGRMGCDSFNVNKYKEYYADLRAAFGNNLPAYYKHYVQFGYKEKRKCI